MQHVTITNIAIIIALINLLCHDSGIRASPHTTTTSTLNTLNWTDYPLEFGFVTNDQGVRTRYTRLHPSLTYNLQPNVLHQRYQCLQDQCIPILEWNLSTDIILPLSSTLGPKTPVLITDSTLNTMDALYYDQGRAEEQYRLRVNGNIRLPKEQIDENKPIDYSSLSRILLQPTMHTSTIRLPLESNDSHDGQGGGNEANQGTRGPVREESKNGQSKKSTPLTSLFTHQPVISNGLISASPRFLTAPQHAPYDAITTPDIGPYSPSINPNPVPDFRTKAIQTTLIGRHLRKSLHTFQNGQSKLTVEHLSYPAHWMFEPDQLDQPSDNSTLSSSPNNSDKNRHDHQEDHTTPTPPTSTSPHKAKTSTSAIHPSESHNLPHSARPNPHQPLHLTDRPTYSIDYPNTATWAENLHSQYQLLDKLTPPTTEIVNFLDIPLRVDEYGQVVPGPQTELFNPMDDTNRREPMGNVFSTDYESDGSGTNDPNRERNGADRGGNKKNIVHMTSEEQNFLILLTRDYLRNHFLGLPSSLSTPPLSLWNIPETGGLIGTDYDIKCDEKEVEKLETLNSSSKISEHALEKQKVAPIFHHLYLNELSYRPIGTNNRNTNYQNNPYGHLEQHPHSESAALPDANSIHTPNFTSTPVTGDKLITDLVAYNSNNPHHNNNHQLHHYQHSYSDSWYLIHQKEMKSPAITRLTSGTGFQMNSNTFPADLNRSTNLQLLPASPIFDHLLTRDPVISKVVRHDIGRDVLSGVYDPIIERLNDQASFQKNENSGVGGQHDGNKLTFSEKLQKLAHTNQLNRSSLLDLITTHLLPPTNYQQQQPLTPWLHPLFLLQDGSDPLVSKGNVRSIIPEQTAQKIGQNDQTSAPHQFEVLPILQKIVQLEPGVSELSDQQLIALEYYINDQFAYNFSQISPVLPPNNLFTSLFASNTPFNPSNNTPIDGIGSDDAFKNESQSTKSTSSFWDRFSSYHPPVQPQTYMFIEEVPESLNPTLLKDWFGYTKYDQELNHSTADTHPSAHLHLTSHMEFLCDRVDPHQSTTSTRLQISGLQSVQPFQSLVTHSVQPQIHGLKRFVMYPPSVAKSIPLFPSLHSHDGYTTLQLEAIVGDFIRFNDQIANCRLEQSMTRVILETLQQQTGSKHDDQSNEKNKKKVKSYRNVFSNIFKLYDNIIPQPLKNLYDFGLGNSPNDSKASNFDPKNQLPIENQRFVDAKPISFPSFIHLLLVTTKYTQQNERLLSKFQATFQFLHTMSSILFTQNDDFDQYSENNDNHDRDNDDTNNYGKPLSNEQRLRFITEIRRRFNQNLSGNDQTDGSTTTGPEPTSADLSLPSHLAIVSTLHQVYNSINHGLNKKPNTTNQQNGAAPFSDIPTTLKKYSYMGFESHYSFTTQCPVTRRTTTGVSLKEQTSLLRSSITKKLITALYPSFAKDPSHHHISSQNKTKYASGSGVDGVYDKMDQVHNLFEAIDKIYSDINSSSGVSQANQASGDNSLKKLDLGLDYEFHVESRLFTPQQMPWIKSHYFSAQKKAYTVQTDDNADVAGWVNGFTDKSSLNDHQRSNPSHSQNNDKNDPSHSSFPQTPHTTFEESQPSLDDLIELISSYTLFSKARTFNNESSKNAKNGQNPTPQPAMICIYHPVIPVISLIKQQIPLFLHPNPSIVHSMTHNPCQQELAQKEIHNQDPTTSKLIKNQIIQISLPYIKQLMVYFSTSQSPTSAYPSPEMYQLTQSSPFVQQLSLLKYPLFTQFPTRALFSKAATLGNLVSSLTSSVELISRAIYGYSNPQLIFTDFFKNDFVPLYTQFTHDNPTILQSHSDYPLAQSKQFIPPTKINQHMVPRLEEIYPKYPQSNHFPSLAKTTGIIHPSILSSLSVLDPIIIDLQPSDVLYIPPFYMTQQTSLTPTLSYPTRCKSAEYSLQEAILSQQSVLDLAPKHESTIYRTTQAVMWMHQLNELHTNGKGNIIGEMIYSRYQPQIRYLFNMNPFCQQSRLSVERDGNAAAILAQNTWVDEKSPQGQPKDSKTQQNPELNVSKMGLHFTPSEYDRLFETMKAGDYMVDMGIFVAAMTTTPAHDLVGKVDSLTEPTFPRGVTPPNSKLAKDNGLAQEIRLRGLQNHLNLRTKPQVPSQYRDPMTGYDTRSLFYQSQCELVLSKDRLDELSLFLISKAIDRFALIDGYVAQNIMEQEQMTIQYKEQYAKWLETENGQPTQSQNTSDVALQPNSPSAAPSLPPIQTHDDLIKQFYAESQSRHGQPPMSEEHFGHYVDLIEQLEKGLDVNGKNRKNNPSNKTQKIPGNTSRHGSNTITYNDYLQFYTTATTFEEMIGDFHYSPIPLSRAKQAPRHLLTFPLDAELMSFAKVCSTGLEMTKTDQKVKEMWTKPHSTSSSPSTSKTQPMSNYDKAKSFLEDLIQQPQSQSHPSSSNPPSDLSTGRVEKELLLHQHLEQVLFESTYDPVATQLLLLGCFASRLASIHAEKGGILLP